MILAADTLFTGFSAVVIIAIIIGLVVHYGRKASKK